jgi:hypothetical protein
MRTSVSGFRGMLMVEEFDPLNYQQWRVKHRADMAAEAQRARTLGVSVRKSRDIEGRRDPTLWAEPSEYYGILLGRIVRRNVGAGTSCLRVFV